MAIFKGILLFLSCIIGGAAFGQDLSAFGLPAVTSVEELNGETTYSLSLQILILMTALTVLPSLVLGMTAFTRIIIVLSILRQALGTQQTPPNQVLIAVALFLSFYVMSPIFEVLYVETVTPFLDGKIQMERALADGLAILKEFMVTNTRVDTLNLFADLSDSGPFADKQSIYILHPNGETDRYSKNRNLFANQPNANIKIYPGSVIFVPRELDNTATRRLAAQAYVSILGNIGVALASLSSINNN